MMIVERTVMGRYGRDSDWRCAAASARREEPVKYGAEYYVQ